MFWSILILAPVIVFAKNLPQNNTVLISTYAKVARWGSGNSTASEARSNSGQTLWTHRSDANIISGQNLDTKKPAVTYHYSMVKPVSKSDYDSLEPLPAKGEIQERFNPRPYFEFSPYAKTHTKTADAQPSVVYGTPITSSNNNPYDSPFNSYNPPDPKPDTKNTDSYPPNDDTKSSPGNTYLPPPTSSYDTPSLTSPSSYASGFVTSGDSKDEYHGPYAYLPEDAKPPADHQDDDMDDEDGDDISYPNHPPKWKDSYNPHDDDIHSQPPPNDDMSYLDHPPKGYKSQGGSMKKPSMAEADLSPPPSDDPQPPSYGNIPQYLDHEPKGYNDFYDHHPIYHEVHPTEAPEDMRVNKGHYSYYYLGRKLWYIPLYFSIYFIIYVTVLILKAIARHKIEFKNHLYHDKHKSARSFSDDDQIDQIHSNVNKALEDGQKYEFM